MNRFNYLLRHDALTFAKRAHVELHGTSLSDDSYVCLLAYDVETIVLGDVTRYLCNLPPGHGKTFFFSVMLAAWVLGHKPSARILIVSYGEDLATEISRQIRTILRSTWFRAAFPNTRLAKDHQSARDFATTVGGRVHARSIDGAITGVRCDWLICDDLVQIRQCTNLAHLEAVNGLFDTDLTTRLNDPRTGRIVVVQHRLNQHDLTGHLQKRSGWTHRVLPLIAPEDCEYKLKNGVWRRMEGDLLRARAFTPEIVAELRDNTGAPGFGPLFQQRFHGADVLQMSREDFVLTHYYVPPAISYIFSVEPNHKGELGQSYGVVQAWGLLDQEQRTGLEQRSGRSYLLYDQWRGRTNRSMLLDQIRRMNAKYRPQVILIEDNGPAMELKSQLESSRCSVELVTPRGDKLSRLRSHLDLFRTRRIVLRAGAPFLHEFLAEFESFPYGDHDDQVDAATQFFGFVESYDLPPVRSSPPRVAALGDPRKARAMLNWNAGRPSGPYVFFRRR